MTLIKYIFPIILAFMPVQAYAQPIQCMTTEQFTTAVQQYGVTPEVLTGKALRNYIDAFNAVTNGDQGYDDFDTLLSAPLGNGKVGWAFFKDGCLDNTEAVDADLVEKIDTVAKGRRVGP